MYRLPIALTLAALILSACSAVEVASPRQTETAGDRMPVQRLAPDGLPLTSQSGLTESARIVVRDAAEWNALWQQIWSGLSPRPALPEIDFQEEMLIVAAMGTRPSGGHMIFVEEAVDRVDQVEVTVRTISPGDHCSTTAAITDPVDVARIPRTERPIRFREQSVVVGCE